MRCSAAARRYTRRMRILVTGGAGYIGSVTATELIERGHDVVVLDDLRTGHRVAVPPAAAFVQADVADERTVDRVVRDHACEAIVHFAASSLVGESMERPLDYFANNTVGTLKLVAAAVPAGVRHIVLSSTAAVYGTPSTVPIPETAEVRPESVYGESKYLVERALGWLSRTSGIGWTALRYFNAAGATEQLGEDHRPESHLIPIVLQAAAGRRSHVEVYGGDYDTPDGTAIRDYVHVADLARAHVLAVEASREGRGATYNLGSGRGYSVAEVVETCRGVTGLPIETKLSARRAGDPPRLVADPSKAASELGWSTTQSDLSTIVASAWQWHREHPRGYADGMGASSDSHDGVVSS